MDYGSPQWEAAFSTFSQAVSRMIIIGIAGAPAGGKSTVAAKLADLGATWINADQVAHEVLAMPDISEQVVHRFGSEVCDDKGQIDRRKLASRVFGDDDSHQKALSYLESVIHPPTRRLIAEKIESAAKAKAPMVVLDVPLLFESGWDRECDEVWFIDTSLAIQHQQAKLRGWTDEDLRQRQSRQLELDEKRIQSTRIIPNHSTIADLHSRVESLWNELINAEPNPPNAG